MGVTPASARLRPSQSDLTEAMRLNDLAMKLYEKDKYDEALPLLIQARASAERSVGPDHPFIAMLLDNLSKIYLIKGQTTDSEPLLQRSLRIREKSTGADSLETSQSTFNLGDFYQMTGDFQKAGMFYERALTIRKKLLKAGDVNTVVTVFRYSCILRKTNREKDAEQIEAASQLNSDKQFPQQSNSASRSSASADASGLKFGRSLSSPKPNYSGVSSKVTVQLLIDEKGSVLNACAVSGNPLLWQSAESAAYKARFSATTLSGVPIRTPGVLTYDFKK